MKNTIKVLLAILLLICTKTAVAQASHKTGFYPVSSLTFKLNWNVGSNQRLEVRVNNGLWASYSGDIVLTDRSNEPNSWENRIYSNPSCWYPVDTTAGSGPRNKINIISVRLINTTNMTIVKDSVYGIGMGSYPYPGYYSSFVTVDPDEFDYMMRNEMEDIEIPGWVFIFSPIGKLEVSQRITFNIASGSSSCMADRSYSIKGDKVMKTSLLSENGTIEDLKSVKARSLKHYAPANHEIMGAILDTSLITIGGMRSRPAILYVNGSYWSLRMFQVKAENERELAKKWNTDKDSIDIISLIHFNLYIDTLEHGCITYTFPLDSVLGKPHLPQTSWRKMNEAYAAFLKGDKSLAQSIAGKMKKPSSTSRLMRDTSIVVCGTYVKFNFAYDSLSTAFYLALGFDSIQFFPEEFVPVGKMVIVRNPYDGQKNMIGVAEEGTADRFQPIGQEMYEMRFDTTHNHSQRLSMIIESDDFLRCFNGIHWTHAHDVIENNVAIALSNKTKPTLIVTDYDDGSINAGPYGDNWDNKIMHDNTIYDKGFLASSIRMIFKDPETKERNLLLYQGMVNSIYRVNRTTGALNKIRSRLMPAYNYHFHAWNGDPNGGTDSLNVEASFAQLRYNFERRNLGALQATVNYWFPNDSLDMRKDYHEIRVVFDSIPLNLTEIVFNRDTLMHFKKNATVSYLRKAIEIDARKLSNNPDYGRLYFKEYPDSGLHFKLIPDSVITLTLVMRPVEVLPVELTYFVCSSNAEGILLSWQTASEFNSDYFVIEYASDDSLRFGSIGVVNAAGNSNTLLNYSFSDAGSGYYRLKQVDNDGHFTYSNTIGCHRVITDTQIHIQEGKPLILFPNPGSGVIYIQGLKDQKGTITVINELSQIVLQQVDNLQQINISLLANGMYMLQLIKDDKIYTGKFIKQ